MKQINMIPVHNYNSNFRNCLNDGTDTDQKVSLPNCKRIAGITKKSAPAQKYVWTISSCFSLLWHRQTGVHSVARLDSKVYRLDSW